MHKNSTNDWLCRKFEANTTMSFKISDKQMLKSTIKYGKELKNY